MELLSGLCEPRGAAAAVVPVQPPGLMPHLAGKGRGAGENPQGETGLKGMARGMARLERKQAWGKKWLLEINLGDIYLAAFSV